MEHTDLTTLTFTCDSQWKMLSLLKYLSGEYLGMNPQHQWGHFLSFTLFLCACALCLCLSEMYFYPDAGLHEILTSEMNQRSLTDKEKHPEYAGTPLETLQTRSLNSLSNCFIGVVWTIVTRVCFSSDSYECVDEGVGVTWRSVGMYYRDPEIYNFQTAEILAVSHKTLIIFRMSLCWSQSGKIVK